MTRKVLYFSHGTNAAYHRLTYRGLMRYAKANGWQIVTLSRTNEQNEARRLDLAIRMFSPIGGISTYSEGLAENWPKDLPSVWLDCNHAVRSRSASFIHVDNEGVSDLAANELLRDVSRRDFVCLSLAGISWSRIRATTFARRVREAGRRCRIVEIAAPDWDFLFTQESIRAALPALPRPCGVFAVCDRLANQLLLAAEAVGISVPGEMSVVSVDNDDFLCLATRTSLTSIQPDWDRCGWLAGESLNALASGGRAQRLTYGPVCILRRASSTVSAKRTDSPLVERVLEYIRTNAQSPIRVGDVVKAAGCSRRLCEYRFKEATGHTILDELRNVRFNLALTLLRQRKANIGAIANLCGFRSTSALRAFFAKQTGQSMRTCLRTQAEPSVGGKAKLGAAAERLAGTEDR